MLENSPTIASKTEEYGGFNKVVRNDGLVPTLRSFELFANKEGKRIDIKDPVFRDRFGAEEVRADLVESEAFFRKYFQNSGAEFRPSMLAEELIKVGEQFELFGRNAKVQQASLYDDYKNNTDFIVKVQHEMRDKKDENLLRASERFVLDVTTDQGERFKEKVKKISAELYNGKLTDVKYVPDALSMVRDIPRFVLQVDEEELLRFFKRVKPALDRASGVDERSFREKYEIFAEQACEKIVEGAEGQMTYLLQCANEVGFPDVHIKHINTLLSSPLGGFHQTLEYVNNVDVLSFRFRSEEEKGMATRYIVMMRKILGVGVALERVLERKKKRASTQ